MKKINFLLIVSALFVGNISHLPAQILNGSFTTGDLTDWQTLGAPTVLTSGGPTPPVGSTQALVQSTDGNPADSVSAATIDATLGITLPPTYDTDVNDLYYYGGPYQPENGQAIYQTFTVGSAATLTFAYSFQSDDYYGFDSTGYVLDGVYHVLASPTNVFPATDPTATTYVTVPPIALSSGTHTLAFVAYNTSTDQYYSVNDTYGPTSLYVTNVVVDVPEPGEWALFVLGCAGLILARKLRSCFPAIRAGLFQE